MGKGQNTSKPQTLLPKISTNRWHIKVVIFSLGIISIIILASYIYNEIISQRKDTFPQSDNKITGRVKQPSPTSFTKNGLVQEFFGYTFQISPSLIKLASPEGAEVCFGHKDESLPRTHQMVTDICLKKINNQSDLTGIPWIEQQSENVSILTYYKQAPHKGEITWKTRETSIGKWYIANKSIDIETARYYAYLFDGKTILQVYTTDEKLLADTINSFKMITD